MGLPHMHVREFPDGGRAGRVHDEPMNGRPLCDLHYAVGDREECPGADCAFWEDGACTFERVSFEFEGRPDVARWLLGIRRELETAQQAVRQGARNGLNASLPPGLRP